MRDRIQNIVKHSSQKHHIFTKKTVICSNFGEILQKKCNIIITNGLNIIKLVLIYKQYLSIISDNCIMSSEILKLNVQQQLLIFVKNWKTKVMDPSTTLDMHNNNDNGHGDHQLQCRMSPRSQSSSSKMSSVSVTTVSALQRRGFADVSNIRIPIIGYEVMEERARFTVCNAVVVVHHCF